MNSTRRQKRPEGVSADQERDGNRRSAHGLGLRRDPGKRRDPFAPPFMTTATPANNCFRGTLRLGFDQDDYAGPFLLGVKAGLRAMRQGTYNHHHVHHAPRGYEGGGATSEAGLEPLGWAVLFSPLRPRASQRERGPPSACAADAVALPRSLPRAPRTTASPGRRLHPLLPAPHLGSSRRPAAALVKDEPSTQRLVQGAGPRRRSWPRPSGQDVCDFSAGERRQRPSPHAARREPARHVFLPREPPISSGWRRASRRGRDGRRAPYRRGPSLCARAAERAVRCATLRSPTGSKQEDHGGRAGRAVDWKNTRCRLTPPGAYRPQRHGKAFRSARRWIIGPSVPKYASGDGCDHLRAFMKERGRPWGERQDPGARHRVPRPRDFHAKASREAAEERAVVRGRDRTGCEEASAPRECSWRQGVMRRSPAEALCSQHSARTTRCALNTGNRLQILRTDPLW